MQKRHISELGLRVLSAAVAIPIVLGMTILGGIWFQFLVLLLAALLANELVENVVGVHAGILRLLTVMLFIGSGVLSINGAVVPALAVGFAGALVFTAMARIQNVRAVIFAAGIIFGNSAVVGLIALRSDLNYGLVAILWLFGVVWSVDSMAYFSGRLIGGPKLAPKISPNKTWAGFYGGLAGAAFAGFIVERLVDLGSEITVIGLSILAGVVAQAGDLQESWAKRQLGVKDSGRLLPGHGGIWDRLDGLIVVVIFATLIGLVRGDAQSVALNLLVW